MSIQPDTAPARPSRGNFPSRPRGGRARQRAVEILGLAALYLLFSGNASAVGELVVPPGWFAGDIHVHWPDGCAGVSDPQSILDSMPDELSVASVLIWCRANRFDLDVFKYFRGRVDNAVSTSSQIVHYDLEVSECGAADRLGHANYLDLADIAFPQSASHQGPIQDWAHAQGAVVGADHSQLFAEDYDHFPADADCCVPYEAPVGVALGRVDYLTYQPTVLGEPESGHPTEASTGWRFLWYTLLDTGFRPAITIGTDAFCLPYPIGSMRTYARITGPLSYENYVSAVAAGRVVVVEQGGGFVEFTVDGVAAGDELKLPEPGTAVELVARLILPAGVESEGALEIVRNQALVASLDYSQTGGEVVLMYSDPVPQSSWYAARTPLSHSSAVFVLTADVPIRASLSSAEYYIAYMDWLSAKVSSGFFAQDEAVDDSALLADIALARGVFEQIKLETVPEATSLVQTLAALLVLVALRRTHTPALYRVNQSNFWGLR